MARHPHGQPRHAVALYRVSTAEQGHSGSPSARLEGGLVAAVKTDLASE
jgi:hypothetical protein